ncbi:hypothetical protein MRX96_020266 [Rhipicephalus microplus]
MVIRIENQWRMPRKEVILAKVDVLSLVEKRNAAALKIEDFDAVARTKLKLSAAGGVVVHAWSQGVLHAFKDNLEERSGTSSRCSCFECVSVHVGDVVILALYLTRNLLKEHVQRCVEETLTDCGEACRCALLIVAGDFNLDISGGGGEWLIDCAKKNDR